MRFITLASAVLLPLLASAQPQGYQNRACGFDMNHNGVIGECSNHAAIGTCPDCKVCDGTTTDPDNDGVAENMVYVACGTGTDNGTCGAAGSPCRTINYALQNRTTGAQNIVCFKGTCAAEPNAMGFGPDGLAGQSGSWPGTHECDSGAFWTRAQTGSEARAFRYPCNPTMVIGWDADNDGDYPPHDPDDTAVIDGAGKERTFDGSNTATGGVPRYTEHAHYSVTNYGTGLPDGAGIKGYAVLGHAVSQGTSTSYDAFHDLRFVDVDRELRWSCPGGDPILWYLFNSRAEWLAVESLDVVNGDMLIMRGEPDKLAGGLESGPIRLKSISFKALGINGWQGFKVWGHTTGVEFLDSVIDANLADWTPQDCHYNSGVLNFSTCLHNVDVVNNTFVDPWSYAIRLQVHAGTASAPANCDREVDNVNIARNTFRSTRQAKYPGCTTLCVDCCGMFGVFIDIDNNDGSSNPSTLYHNNVTIVDNIFFSGVAANTPGWNAIFDTAARNGATGIPGTHKIINNTFRGRWGTNNYPDAAVYIFPEYGGNKPIDNVIFKNNVFAGMAGGDIAVRTSRALTNFQADYNVYDPDASFIWSNGSATSSLATWQSQSGEGTHAKKNCEPLFVDGPNGNLHLQGGDLCAVNAGVDLSAFTTVDIDNQTRPFQGVWDAGADEVDTGAATTTTVATTTTTTVPTTTTTASSTTTTTAAVGAFVDCGPVYSTGGFSDNWDTSFYCVPCTTGSAGTGYRIAEVRLRAGTVESPGTFKAAVYPDAARPTSTPLCATAETTLTGVTQNNLSISGCPTLGHFQTVWTCFITGAAGTELGDLSINACSSAASSLGQFVPGPGLIATIGDQFSDLTPYTWQPDGCDETVWLHLEVLGGVTTTTTTSPGGTTTTAPSGSVGGGSVGGGSH